MRSSLRWKILLLVVLTPATLAVATLFTVSRNVTTHVNSSSIHENLEHTGAVFESMLKARSRGLVGDARVIARDPRFFSLVMLEPVQRDSRYSVTVRGMVQDFQRIVQTELFEVFDRRGRILASAGEASSGLGARDDLIRSALKRATVQAVLATGGRHYQAALVPIMASGQVVGVLLLGESIGAPLARELRSQMRCDVTFLSGTTITGTSLDAADDRLALVREIQSLRRRTPAEVARLPVRRVQASGVTYLTLVRRIPLSDPATQQLYAIQRSFDPETSFLHVMQGDLLKLAAIALLAALLTGLLFGEQVLRPIQSLVRGAQEMEKGNYDHPLRIRRRDELGYLADRFVDMRQRERAYLGSLEQATALKSHFLSIASHELRTPISVLIAYRDILAAGELGPITPQQEEALATMQGHLQRLTRVAEDAAHFARVKSDRRVPDFESHDIEALLNRAVAMARAAGSGRAVGLELSCDLSGEIEADGGDLELALLQLITNGIRFTPDGGRVSVDAREVGDRLRITIRDTGVGVDQSQLEALLSGEFAVPEAGNYRSSTGLAFNVPGLGLGLPIARSIVEAHGGTLRAESRVGEGCTFAIEIPLVQIGQVGAA
jgi:signal transduction histidine kinase